MARPVGATTKPQIGDYIGKKNIEKLTGIAVKKAEAGDVVMLKFLLEQVYGRPAQNINMGGDLRLEVKFDESFDFTSKAKGNSTKQR